MKLKQSWISVLAWTFNGLAIAQYGTPESLKAEMTQGDDLVFARQAKPLSDGANLSNTVFLPAEKTEVKRPALVIVHSCGGLSKHIELCGRRSTETGLCGLDAGRHAWT